MSKLPPLLDSRRNCKEFIPFRVFYQIFITFFDVHIITVASSFLFIFIIILSFFVVVLCQISITFNSICYILRKGTHTENNKHKLQTVAPCKGIRIPESGKLLFAVQLRESRILLRIGIQNPRSTDKDSNPAP